MIRPICVICEGRETVESMEWLQYRMEVGLDRPSPMPVCASHYYKLEECHNDKSKIRTPPVVVNVSAVTTGAWRGNS